MNASHRSGFNDQFMPERCGLFFALIIILFCSSSLIGQNRLNSRLFYVKPRLYHSKTKVNNLDLSRYDILIALPVDDRDKFYGEVIYKDIKTHELEEFFRSSTVTEIQNKMEEDFKKFRSVHKNNSTHKKILVNTSVEVFYPKLNGFVHRKSFAKVRLVIITLLSDSLLIRRKYESLYGTNGMDQGFEGDVSMTVEEGENVTVGMALRESLDKYYTDLNQVLSLKENEMIIYGKVINEKSLAGVNASISFRSDNSDVIECSSTGDFQTIITKAKRNVQIIASGFMAYSQELDLSHSHKKMMEINFKLKPIEEGAVVKLDNILFEVGTTRLLKESFIELDEVVDFLKRNPKVRIELQGHTDNQGSALNDLELSQQRVDKIKSYLVSQGIKSNRVSGKGFGNTRPIASNDTEEERRLNRRVEFVIIKK